MPLPTFAVRRAASLVVVLLVGASEGACSGGHEPSALARDAGASRATSVGDTFDSRALDVVTGPAPLTVCSGECVPLTATVHGGVAPYELTWSPALVDGRACPTSSTTYTASVVDSSGSLAGEPARRAATASASLVLRVQGLCGGARSPVRTREDEDGGAPRVAWASWSGTRNALAGQALGSLDLGSGRVVVTFDGAVQGKQVQDFLYPAYTLAALGPTAYAIPIMTSPFEVVLLDGETRETRGIQTLTFSRALTNPIIAISGLGDVTRKVTWTFREPFKALPFAIAPVTPTIVVAAGNALSGQLGSGILQLDGVFSSVHWVVTSEGMPSVPADAQAEPVAPTGGFSSDRRSSTPSSTPADLDAGDERGSASTAFPWGGMTVGVLDVP